jgi:transposase InsO family protein
MEVSTSAYYAWCKAPQDGDNQQQDQLLADKVQQIFTDNQQCFGSRRLSERLKKQGLDVGRFKTRRIMRDLKLVVRYPKRFKATTDSNHSETISPNRLDRQFKVTEPNRVWATDITYVWTLQGWLYVAVVIDLFSRQVVGWAIDDHMRTSLCIKALQMAFWRRKPPLALLHHSDRGSQYASCEYREHLAVMGMEQSMSRKGNCWDNSPTERFFRSLKHEQLNYEKFKTQEAARLSVIDVWRFITAADHIPHWVIKPQSNLSGNFLEMLPEQVSGFFLLTITLSSQIVPD